MEAIEYNGIHLQSLETLRFHREQMRDDAGNYLRTKWEIDVVASYQPSQTAYTADKAGNPIPTPGTFPGETDNSIREALLTPRGLLKVTSGGSVVLETPSLKPDGVTRFKTDVLNGPVCEVISAPRQIGYRHWLTQLRFVAHTFECETEYSSHSSSR